MNGNAEKVSVEMTVDDLFALHSVLNGVEAMDEVFGPNEDRTRYAQQLADLRRRFKAAQAEQQASEEEHSVKA